MIYDQIANYYNSLQIDFRKRILFFQETLEKSSIHLQKNSFNYFSGLKDPSTKKKLSNLSIAISHVEIKQSRYPRLFL